MNKKLIGNPRPDAEALSAMRQSPYQSARWAAYQNHDLGHRDLGHLKFLAVGPENTFKTPPEKMPDTINAINWRYIFVGWVNLENGDITET